MAALLQKHVVLGVTGGIAAYKSAEIIRRLRDQGAEVRVVMTAAAQQFITPLTLQALSGEPVHTDLLDPAAEAAMGHIELARWADVILVAPASADFLARVVVGRGDDLLTTLCLATKAPLVFAPAMNQQMWAAAATQANIQTLQTRGVKLIGPASGSQACGDVGLGRMVEPTDIVQQLPTCFDSGVLSGKKVVITAGPTREALDPVRFITNHSSGKMGFAIAEAAREAGAAVTLISGPVNLPTPDRVKRVNVVSAQDMLNASLEAVKEADIFIATAAVADYRPAQIAKQKIKKSGDELTIQLVKNPDIVATIAALPNKPFTVG
ncbi:MAG TPA: bifunctional phosphopantothenoylcysteine decarboxylase/phosphopantothenate--cysteine ligase CoaBC, partial [Pseudomonadales bacterium]|nr:bifunctional phosphopantothenoylcysteine decarboxylase/phosphopantothenate--cysteine ligase CoaBC [Pseudomonadales bacterium]